MTLFQTLLKAQAPTFFEKSEEYSFYRRNSYILSDHESIAHLAKAEDFFGVIRANIVIRAILNKEEIEKILSQDQNIEANEQINALLASLPHIVWKGEKIYVPIFPAALAGLYTSSFKKLFESPYKKLLSNYDAAIIDSFDYYGHALYESDFAKLTVIKKHDDAIAVYDKYSESIYIINEQGRLDNTIALFDKHLKAPNKDHVARRAKKVVEAYFENKREELVDSLFEEKFISEKLYKSLVEEKR